MKKKKNEIREKKPDKEETHQVDKNKPQKTKRKMKINISKKKLKKKIYVGRKNSAKKNFIVQSLANMIFIHNILTSYEDDSCFNKRIPLE